MVHPFAAAAILSVLFMGVIGAFVVYPIVSINWAWNSVIAHFSTLPKIGIWQSSLLYLAGVCCIYLLGLVDIELQNDTENLE